MKKNILALILASLLLASSMASCSDNQSEKESESQSTTSTESGETESGLTYLDNVPDTAKFNGYTVRYISSVDDDSIYVDVDEDEAIDDIVDESVWRRNNIVEDRLDVEIELVDDVDYNDYNKIVRNSLNAQSDDYDVFVGHQRFQAELASQGYMKNLSNLEYLDFSQPYWAPDYIDKLSYEGVTYWATGDMANRFIGMAWVNFCNASLWDQYYGDQNLFDIVREGKWTIDKLSSLVEGVYTDANGNGEKDYDDVYGMFLEYGIRAAGLMYASDVLYTSMDSDGVPYISVENEHTYSAFEKVHDLLSKNDGVFTEDTDEKAVMKKFARDEFLFVVEKLDKLEMDAMREMESDYYVTVLPKYDESQENYITTHYDGVTIIGIPITVSEDNIDAVSATLEVTSSVSHEISLPTYYDSALKNKYSRDKDQAEMIDLIHDTITGDFSLCYGDVVGARSSLYTFWGKNLQRDSISSVLAKNVKVWKNDLESLIESFGDNAEN